MTRRILVIHDETHSRFGGTYNNSLYNKLSFKHINLPGLVQMALNNNQFIVSAVIPGIIHKQVTLMTNKLVRQEQPHPLTAL